jgi:hypothetical protein
MLLQKIRQDERLKPLLRDRCEDEGVCVEIDKNMAKDDYIILKLDSFYNTLDFATPPPSPDCFIIQRCAGTDKYGITIVELKGISTSDGFKVENMKAKFETCFQEFMLKDFNRDYTKIQLYFVSEIEIYRREAGLKMKVLENIRFTFRGQKCSIKPYKPTPAIKPCY